jgi:hypothetical protein
VRVVPEVNVDDEVILCNLEAGGRVKLNVKFGSRPIHRKDSVKAPKKCHTLISSNFIIQY